MPWGAVSLRNGARPRQTVPNQQEVDLIRHVAMFTWTEGATRDEIRTFATELTTMPGAIDLIRRYEHGDDLGLGSATADYVLVADFDTVEDYWAYSGHPYHVEFLEKYAQPIIASVARAQYHLAP